VVEALSIRLDPILSSFIPQPKLYVKRQKLMLLLPRFGIDIHTDVDTDVVQPSFVFHVFISLSPEQRNRFSGCWWLTVLMCSGCYQCILFLSLDFFRVRNHVPRP
jgi:hypothetical protein